MSTNKDKKYVEYALLALKYMGAYDANKRQLKYKMIYLTYQFVTVSILILCGFGFRDVNGRLEILARKTEAFVIQLHVRRSFEILKNKINK